MTVWALASVVLTWLLTLDHVEGLRAWVAVGATAGVWVLSRRAALMSPSQPWWRLACLLLGAGLTLRYLAWRTTHTLDFDGPASAVAGIVLYLAELYAAMLLFISLFTNALHLRRAEAPLPADPDQWPTVDVLIPSYNEPAEMLTVTLLAALQIRYPADKLRVYLLDDGGTVAKRNDADPARASAAWLRHLELQALCERTGARYLTRERNEHAKAGNINAALKHTHGELVLVLDSDHVPTVDILERTVGHFTADASLFLVQTPHFFISPDPIEKNLGIFGKMPAENEMFYGRIQLGLDFWEASFFCGSAAVLRRSCLEAVGGISTQTITEDSETALMMHARGWRSAYVDRAMVSGLQPETFTGFIIQRMRWAQGMLQILLLARPLTRPGLHAWQRVAYLSNIVFWLFPLARLVFLLAPAAYLLAGLNIYQAGFSDMALYVAPHMAAGLMLNTLMFGRVRMPFISGVYEVMQSLFLAPGVVRLLLRPRAPTFQVTPKGETLDHDVISSLARPFYVVYAISLLIAGVGLLRLLAGWGPRELLAITLGWEVANLVLLHVALAALLEKRQRRSAHRVPTDEPAEVDAGAGPVPVHVTDIATHGVQVTADLHAALPAPGAAVHLRVYNAALGRHSALPVVVRNRRVVNGRLQLGMSFDETAFDTFREAVAYAHGDSARWEAYRRARQTPHSAFRAFFTLLHIGTVGSLALWQQLALQLRPQLAAAVASARARLRAPAFLSRTPLPVKATHAHPDPGPRAPNAVADLSAAVLERVARSTPEPAARPE